MAVSHADRFMLTLHVVQQMWDRGTHMGAQEWRVCRRVQDHPKLLDVR